MYIIIITCMNIEYINIPKQAFSLQNKLFNLRFPLGT
jgi:hypothetical protein